MTSPSFDPIRILDVLNRHGVEYVVIGGIAAMLQGSPTNTYDLDVCYKRDKKNINALVEALRELGARLRGFPPELRFELDAKAFLLGDTMTFETTFGDFDCLGNPSGTTGFADLARSARPQDLADGVRVSVCSLDDLIRMKKAASRPKDLREVAILEMLKQVTEGRA